MGSSLSPDSRKKLTSWLYYFDDLHLGGFYRGRKRQERPAEMEAMAAEVAYDAPLETVQRVNEAATGPAVAASALSHNMPKSYSADPRPALPAIPAESLFASLDRVAEDSLPRIREDLGECDRCRLHRRRTQIVFGVGNPHAKLVFVGEGPGHDEDIQGEPFVGRAGKLLTQMIEAMGLKREDVYICNVVKCRPPENRKPEDDEIATCSPYLYRQIDAIAPKAIVGLGAVAVQALLKTKDPISRYRGQWFDFRGAKLMPTYHPAYLLRNPAAKGEVWKDLQKVMEYLGLPLKKRSRAET